MEPPKVFISYSHDSDKHKEWVLKLCTKLREDGVEVILDHWDLGPGDDLTLFMERGVRDSDRVLVICTDTYVRKANAGEGGVGYERLIVTAQLARDLGTNKFIPIIRQSSNDEKTPTFLATRVYIDFTDDDKFDEKFKELLHGIHEVPITQKPPLGKNPLSNQPSEPEVLSRNLPEIPEKIESVPDVYESAFELARADDIMGWSRLVEQTRQDIFKSLVLWRQKELDRQRAENTEQKHQVMDKVVDIVAPLISVALAGIESHNKHFNDQRSLLDDFLNIQSLEGWDRTGYTPWLEIPYALGNVYHNLHGSLCLHINRLDLAFNLAQSKFPLAEYPHIIRSVWQNHKLMGSYELLGYSRKKWEYLANAFERWEWLSLIFADDTEYRIALVAYHMILSIHELAAVIASGKEKELEEYYTSVDFYFLTEEYEIIQRAPSLLVHHSELSELWTALDVTRMQMESLWEDWIKLHKSSYCYPDSTEDTPKFEEFFDFVYY